MTCPRCQTHFWGGVIITCLTTAAAVVLYIEWWKRSIEI